MSASTGLTSSDITSMFSTEKGDLIVQFSTGDFITVDAHFYKSGQWLFLNDSIERITFLYDNSYVDLDTNADVMTFKGSAASDDIELDSANTGMAYILYGFAGNDRLFGDDGNDEIYGGSGSDWIDGYDGDDYIEGGSGDDWIGGNIGDDIIYGGDGNDDIRGGVTEEGTYDDDDQLYGEAGKDILRGDYGDDILDGGTGDDILYGDKALEYNPETEEQEVAGNDTYYASLGNDTIIDGGGTLDVIIFPEGTDYEDLIIVRVDNDLTIRGGPTSLDRWAAYLRWNPVSAIMPPLRNFLLHFHILSVKPDFGCRPLPVS